VTPTPGKTLCVQTATGHLSMVIVGSDYDTLLLGLTGNLLLVVSQWG
jgi:hypothetical protein